MENIMENIKKVCETLNLIKAFEKINDKEQFANKIVLAYGNDIDICKELLKMELWIECNPKKAPKKLLKKFINSWLNRCNKPFQPKRKFNDGSQQYRPSKEII